MTYGKIDVRVAKADASFPIDFDALPEASRRFLVEYGLRQKLNDTVSDPKYKDAKLAHAAVTDTIDGLESGDFRRGGGGGPRLSPVEVAMRQLVVDALVAKGHKKADATKAAPGVIERSAPEAVAAIREKAEALVAKARNALDGIELTLD